MLEKYLSFLVCPVSHSNLRLEKISVATKKFNNGEQEVINDGILFADKDWFYPIVNGVPSMLIESFLDHEDFLKKHLPDYQQRKENLLNSYPELIQEVI